VEAVQQLSSTFTPGQVAATAVPGTTHCHLGASFQGQPNVAAKGAQPLPFPAHPGGSSMRPAKNVRSTNKGAFNLSFGGENAGVAANMKLLLGQRHGGITVAAARSAQSSSAAFPRAVS
jgi:hypothetical protein